MKRAVALLRVAAQQARTAQAAALLHGPKTVQSFDPCTMPASVARLGSRCFSADSGGSSGGGNQAQRDQGGGDDAEHEARSKDQAWETATRVFAETNSIAEGGDLQGAKKVLKQGAATAQHIARSP
jgi:hypothetical protein